MHEARAKILTVTSVRFASKIMRTPKGCTVLFEWEEDDDCRHFLAFVVGFMIRWFFMFRKMRLTSEGGRPC